MPFKPHFIPAADAPLTPAGEIDLPGDLATLADQLHDDATHLAATYPPSLRVERQPVSHFRNSRSAAAIATSLAFLAAATVLLWPSAAPLTEATPDTLPEPDYITTVSLADLSSPELEGLLDLIERQPETVTVSF